MRAYSPLSTDHLLGILAEGAPDPERARERVPAGTRDRLAALAGLDHSSVHALAGVWSRAPISREFAVAVESWRGHATTTSSDPVAQINGWARVASDGMIPELFDRLDDVELVVASALSLRARWAYAMERGTTVWDGDEVRSVERIGRLRVGGGPGSWCVRLPLLDADLHARIRVGGADEEETERRASLSFPAFHVESTTSLSETVGEEVWGADYARMLADPSPLSITGAVQRTSIDCDEHGLAAAAVSAVALGAMAAPAEPALEVVVDEPFAFEILHRGSPIFEAWVDEIREPRTTSG